MKDRLLTAAFIAAFFILPGLANATDYYVATTGSDSNAGTQASPFRTITFGYNRAVAGDRVLVQPGTYTDYTSGWGLKFTTSGTASAPITVKSVTRGAAIIDASASTSRPACVYLYGTSYNIIDGFVMTGCTIEGVGLFANGGTPSAFNQIINNEIYNVSNPVVGATGTGGQGISSTYPDHDNYYAQNYIHDIGVAWDDGLDHGMYIGGTNDSAVNNLLIHNTHGAGIQVAAYGVTNNMVLYNNTFANNGWNGITVWSTAPANTFGNLLIYNNITYNSVKGIRGCSATGTIILKNNISFGNSGTNYNTDTCGGGTATWTNTNLIQSDPLFVNSTSNFTLQAGSPAAGAGVAIPTVTIDFAGSPRSQTSFDIGAYAAASHGCP